MVGGQPVKKYGSFSFSNDASFRILIEESLSRTRIFRSRLLLVARRKSLTTRRPEATTAAPHFSLFSIMDTPLEESNLAFIGSDEDKAAREAAASLEIKWEGAGDSPGIQIWRVENRRDEDDNPVFGVEHWPTERHGEFYKGKHQDSMV